MAKGWNSKRRCPICGGSGWGKSRCRGFLHSDGSAVFCEHGGEREGTEIITPSGYEKTSTTVAPFGIPLRCYRKIL